MSYSEYLQQVNDKPCRRSWIWWKMECFGMTEAQAIKASYDKEWGYNNA